MSIIDNKTTPIDKEWNSFKESLEATEEIYIYADEAGNKYFEKDGKIYMIDVEGNLIDLGKGRINPTGEVVLAEGQIIEVKEKEKIIKLNNIFEKLFTNHIFEVYKDRSDVFNEEKNKQFIEENIKERVEEFINERETNPPKNPKAKTKKSNNNYM